MPSNKKKKQQQRRCGGRPSGPNSKRDAKPASGPRGPRNEHMIGTEPNASWPRRMTKRPTPKTVMDDAPRGQTRAAVLTVPEAERTPTVERLATAYKLLDDVEAFLQEYAQPTPPKEGDFIGIPINALMHDDDLVRACGKLIHAVVLSDKHVGIPTTVFRQMLNPGCMNRITDLTPLGETRVQLMELPARAFVVLLANAFLSFWMDSPPLVMVAKRVVHELHAHVEGGCDGLDWSELEELGCDWLTEDLCRFAMATLGVSASRRLYQLSGDMRRTASFTEEKPSTRRLLNDVEAFSKEQYHLRPACAVGYWNLGWVASQCPSRRNADGLAAAAECYRIFTKTYEVADEESDDFLSASARIEAAGMLTVGGGGIVGLFASNGEPVQVKRDYRSAFAVTDGGTYVEPDGFCALTRQGIVDVLEHERRRLERGVPITKLEPGETFLVEWWLVLKLWNEAMVHYDAVCRFGHGGIVYGNASMWELCVDCLLSWTDEQRLDLDEMEYAKGLVEPGISKYRDRGRGFNECEACGEASANKTCTGCKRMQYCSIECQRADWEKGHKKECRKLAALHDAIASQRE